MNDDLSNFREVIGTSLNETLEGQDWQVNDLINGKEGDDNIRGYSGDDFLIGHLGHDIIEGGSGNDRIYGDVVSDPLSQGNDTLIGGIGDDTLTGGKGSDLFVFGAFDGKDIITDFEQGIDKIYLNVHNYTQDYSSGTFEESALKFSDLTIIHTSNSTMIYVSSTSTVNYAGDNSPTITTELTNMIKLNGVMTLTESDFILV